MPLALRGAGSHVYEEGPLPQRLNPHSFAAPQEPSAYRRSCPLCGGSADARRSASDECRFLLPCRHCRVFVIDQQLADVIDNARTRNLTPVLQYLPWLSRATQRAAARGTVMQLTSTNWVRVALDEQLRLAQARELAT